MQKKYYWTLLVISLLFLASCRRTATRGGAEGEPMTMVHSALLTMSELDGSTVVKISNPWNKTQVLAQYQLIDRADSGRVELLDGYTTIYTPLRRSVVVESSPHVHLFNVLNCLKSVIWQCENSVSATLEKTVALRADAMFVSTFQGNPVNAVAERAGVPLVECADYLEPTALGRAEWMRFYGKLFGKDQLADSLFATVCEAYSALKTMALQTVDCPKVITEKIYQGIWYVPSPQSTKARIIADAGGQYAFENEEIEGDNEAVQGGALSLSPERVLKTAADADIWTFSSSVSITPKLLKQEYKGYTQIKAFANGNVWQACGRRYFDETAFRPDLLLREYITLIHPELGLGKPQYHSRCVNIGL